MKKVFVSGCYDMLHSGHVAFLEEAAKLGDLYVGLGSDATIWELKGRRTINNNAERLYMVKALRCVKDAWINSGSGILSLTTNLMPSFSQKTFLSGVYPSVLTKKKSGFNSVTSFSKSMIPEPELIHASLTQRNAFTM